ncbi:hypothetical protein STENM223S_08110 [Streptomyces tendae]
MYSAVSRYICRSRSQVRREELDPIDTRASRAYRSACSGSSAMKQAEAIDR